MNAAAGAAVPTAPKTIGRWLLASKCARTSFWPGFGPSVQLVVARPLASVATAAALTEPPPKSTVKFTLTPATGRPKPSSTPTTRAPGKRTPGVPSCPAPLTYRRLLWLHCSLNVSCRLLTPSAHESVTATSPAVMCVSGGNLSLQSVIADWSCPPLTLQVISPSLQ